MDGRRADRRRRVAWPDSASTCCSAPPDGHDLLARGLEAQAATACARRRPRRGGASLVTKASRLPAARSARHGLDRARRRLVADPDAAVEVEEEGGRRARGRRDGHGSAPIILAAVRRPCLALCCACCSLAGCGGDDETTATRLRPTAPQRAVTCKEVAAPRARGRANLAGPKAQRSTAGASATTSTCRRTAARSRSRLDVRPRAEDGVVVRRRCVKRGFYDGLTFHRVVARLRHPGRRPARRRHRRARLHDRRAAAGRPRLHDAASSRWPRPRSSRPAPRAASSSS